jgi:glycosyltransferase involved in cell wall biosynthesis
MNICFDGRVLKNGLVSDGGRTGIYFVARNILLELYKREVNVYLFLDKGDASILDKLNQSLNINISPDKIMCSDSDFSNINAFFSPIFKVPDEVKKYPNVSCYTVIHDIIYLLFPEYFNDSHKQPWVDDLISSINNMDYYFSNSDYTKKDFLKYFKNMNPQHVDTMLLSTNFDYNPIKDSDLLRQVRQKYNIPSDKKYLFSLCSLEPRKNLIRAVKCFIEFIKKHNINDLVYVLGGGSWNGFIEKLETEVPEYKFYADKIIRAGYVADSDLSTLYSNAEFFVYTSQYEGFGMPPLEAMSCGCPVITSNNSSLPEVVGDAAIMIDWDSDEQHISAYEKYYFDNAFRVAMAQKGLRRSKRFSWKKAVDVILNRMQVVENKKSNQPLVTVITASFNLIKNHRKESFIQNLESVRQQTYKNIEHIVIDGASTDGTLDLLKEYQDKGLIKYYSEPDKGIYDAMNKGILKAKGKYVVCLNSDDFYSDNRAVEMLVRKAEENDADACFADADRVNPQTLELMDKWIGKDSFQPWCIAFPCHQTWLIKTGVMKELGLYDIKYKVSADNAFFVRLVQHNKKIVNIDRSVIKFRDGGYSNGNMDVAKQNQIDALFEEYGQYHNLTKQDVNNLIHNQFLNLSLEDALVLGSKLEKPEYIQNFFERWVSNNMKTNVIIMPNGEQQNPNAAQISQYNLFDKIPLLKIKQQYGVKRYLLFGFLPIIKNKYIGDTIKTYLLAFIPLMFKSKINHINYEEVQSGIYNFSKTLPFKTEGLQKPEDWGAWSDGDKTSLYVKTNGKRIAIFDVNPFLTPNKTKQVLTLWINDCEKQKYVFEAGKKFPKIIVKLPKSDNLHIMFKYEDVKSPAELGVSDDARKIAIGFRTLEIKDK